MKKFFLTLLKAPAFDNEEDTLLSGFLHITLLVLIPAAILISIIDGLAGIPITGIILLPGAALLVLTEYFLHKRRLRQAGILLLTVLVMVLTFLMLTGQGLHDIGITMYPLILLVAALVLNQRRDYVAIFTLEITSLVFINRGEYYGLFKTLDRFEPRLADLLIISVILLVAAIALRSIAENLKNSLQKVRNSELALAASNRELEKRAHLLQVSEARWRSVIDNAPAVILSIVFDGTVTFSNQLDEDGNDFYVGKCIYDSVPAERLEVVRGMVAYVFETGKPRAFETLLLDESGEPRWFVVKMGPVLTPESKVNDLIIIAEDIHDRKKAEEQVHILNTELEARVLQRTEELETANRELESFSYTVSHDLRAPLRAIHGYSRILAAELSEGISPGGKTYLKNITDSAQKMGVLIDDLLAFSRLGRKAISREPVDMAWMAQQVFDEVTQGEVRERIHFSIGELPVVHADLRLLRQVFVNLIGNAVKFSRKRGLAEIEVGVKRENGPVIFFVKDNGAGFDITYAGKLFEVFTRLHTDEQFEGTGVGLAIVHRIIEKHGGRIWAESEIDKGTIFYFTLGS